MPLKQQNLCGLYHGPVCSQLGCLKAHRQDQLVSSQCLGRFMASCQELSLNTSCSDAHCAQRSARVEHHTFTPASYGMLSGVVRSQYDAIANGAMRWLLARI